MGEQARDKVEERIDEAREVYNRHGRAFHLAWVGAAVLVILAGIVMMVFPGPALVAIPVGLAMLAVVFGWARKLLLFGAGEGADLVHAWKDASTGAKVATVVVLLVAAGGLAVWFFL